MPLLFPRKDMLLLAMAVIMLTASPALAKKWDLFISANDRQLRSISLIAKGFAEDEQADQDEQFKEAMEMARQEALRLAAKELGDEILDKNPTLTFEFMGQQGPAITPGVPSTMPNVADPALQKAVFVQEWEEIPPSGPRLLGVKILCEVAYVLLLPAQEDSLANDSSDMLDEIEGSIDDDPDTIESALDDDDQDDADAVHAPDPDVENGTPLAIETPQVPAPDPIPDIVIPSPEEVQEVVIPRPDPVPQATLPQGNEPLAMTPTGQSQDPEGYDPLAGVDPETAQQELHRILQEKLDSLLGETQ